MGMLYHQIIQVEVNIDLIRKLRERERELNENVKINKAYLDKMRDSNTH